MPTRFRGPCSGMLRAAGASRATAHARNRRAPLLRGAAIGIFAGMSERRSSRHGTLDPLHASGPSRRLCDWPDCELGGDYRAPKSRERLREFHHFCLEHVRAYNLAWDFFAGMSQADIEGYLREDVTWHRPTWPLGSQHRPTAGWRWQDPYHLFLNGDGLNGAQGASEWDRVPGRQGKLARMLAVLDLAPGATRAELKARYKQLAKRHHPDLHGGDKRAEERLKLINEAYTYLLDSDHFA
jgi:DnaJ-domain-containing protein 1